MGYYTYEGGEMQPVAGVVYCFMHGCIHDDTTDPYQCEGDQCRKSEHRKVFARAKAGDFKLKRGEKL